MAETTYKFETHTGATVHLTEDDISGKVECHRRALEMALGPGGVRQVYLLQLWPQDQDALFKLRAIEAEE